MLPAQEKARVTSAHVAAAEVARAPLQMRKIVQAKANEKVTCDADPSFYLKCARFLQLRVPRCC